ncbi:MAG: 1-aminocyclopropane-1-carboxylate deaminase/D-cysteine desulfhydrase [Pseudomonadales bacterium]
MVFPPRLRLAQTPTPLMPMHRFCLARGLPLIWLKRDDLTHSAASGNKIRKLEFCLAEARQQEADVVLTYGGLQSNHCRATALLCAQLGIRCHLVLRSRTTPDEPADGNLLLDHLAGARISYVPARELASNSKAIENEIVAEYKQQGLKTYCIPIGASDATGLWGYVAAAAELATDFDIHSIDPSHIVTASGSGGTQSGLMVGAKAFGLSATVSGINVCDDQAWFEKKIRADLNQWEAKYQSGIDVAELDINMLDGHIGEGYAKASDEVLETIAAVAKSEGIVFDPVYTGKAFNGLLKEIAAGRFDQPEDLVFMHTGGVFGLFPFKERFSQLAKTRA